MVSREVPVSAREVTYRPSSSCARKTGNFDDVWWIAEHDADGDDGVDGGGNGEGPCRDHWNARSYCCGIRRILQGRHPM